MPDQPTINDLDGMLFSENNHWQFGWGQGRYNYDEQHLPLWVRFGPCRREPESFATEIAIAARKVADAARKPIYLAMSGGLDSELIARTFIQEKIPFRPIIARFERDYNLPDISYALDFSKAHHLDPEILDVNIKAFLLNALYTPYACSKVAHLLQMHLMRHVARLGGMTVTGVGQQRYEMEKDKVCMPVAIEHIAVTHCMYAEEGIEGVSAFFCYTPEMMLSFLREAKQVGFEGMSERAHTIKETIYRRYWPEMPERPQYRGFEQLEDLRRSIQYKLVDKYKGKIQRVMIEINALERQLAYIPE